jgi:CheY-like chemotaxis protein
MAGRPLRVLVVDDYPDTAESLAVYLGVSGHDVRAARGGPEALALLDGWTPDVAIIDLLMPGMDGFDVAERLSEGLPRRPLLVAVSGSVLAEHRRRAAEAFDLHLIKPVDPGELADLLRAHADRLDVEWDGLPVPSR